MSNRSNRVSKLNVEELQTTWLAFERIAGVRALKTEDDHQHALQLMRALWDVVGGNASHPLASLFELMVVMISDYEKKRYPVPKSEPHEMLAFMMEQGDRSATDLSEIVDSAQLEEILSGRQNIDLPLVVKFAEYFGVSRHLFGVEKA